MVKNRRYSVGYLPNNGKPNPSPQLTISGKWLKELGFEVGTHYTPHSPSRTVDYPVG
ncbi:SymE family type I addiction module toxin [Providencia vermicola]|uniref:SymE family type I addiction module toxin n=1 Tax=Providencia vermicola TaxID=333965 RepID=UPI001CECCBC8|nr:SymE family type I addiction module toxin [Providencia vermicola]